MQWHWSDYVDQLLNRKRLWNLVGLLDAGEDSEECIIIVEIFYDWRVFAEVDNLISKCLTFVLAGGGLNLNKFGDELLDVEITASELLWALPTFKRLPETCKVKHILSDLSDLVVDVREEDHGIIDGDEDRGEVRH